MIAAWLERVGHVPHDVRLRDCLVKADGERAILVRALAKLHRNEKVPRHAGHRTENGRVGDTSRGNLGVDHLPACGLRARAIVLLSRWSWEGKENQRGRCKSRHE
jgi:hypothetical protein